MAFTYAGQYGPVTADSIFNQLLVSTAFTVYDPPGQTSTKATLYTDRTKGTTTANPTTTDSSGNMTFFAVPGRYDVACNGVTLTVVVSPDPADLIGIPGTGTVTNVSSSSAAITVATPTSTPVLTPVFGTTAATFAQGNDSRIASAVQSVTAADGSIAVAGTATAPTVSRAALTGDITASAGSNATTLKNTGPGATGPTGSGTSVPVVTIDAQGRVTALTSAATVGTVAASDSSIVVGGTATAPTIQRAALTGDATASAGSNALTLATVNSNVGTFGDSTHVGQFTVNGKGLITAASSVALSTSSALLGSVFYNPVADPAYSVNTSSITALDTTNLRLTVTPTTTSLLVGLCAYATGTSSQMTWAVMVGATVKDQCLMINATFGQRFVARLHVTGLTAGTPVSIDFAALATGTTNIRAGTASAFGPITMEAYAS